MTTSSPTERAVPTQAPPRWANAWMKWALTTPVLQTMLGRGLALLTFEGRRSGKRYTIPISYQRDGDTVTVITKRARNWWHNFEAPIEVELRLAGREYTGKARIDSDHAGNLEFMTDYLKERPIDAKAFGLARDEVIEERIAQLLPELVIIRIDVSPRE